VSVEVDPNLEMTEVCDRVLKAGGPALLFESPRGTRFRSSEPVRYDASHRARNGSRRGCEPQEALRDIGVLLAFLKEPDPPGDFATCSSAGFLSASR